MAAQEQALRTNLVKAKLDGSQEDSKCRMCRQADENNSHLLRECSKLTQKEYNARHDWMGKRYIGRYVGTMVLKQKQNGMNINHKQYVQMKSTKSCGTFQ